MYTANYTTGGSAMRSVALLDRLCNRLASIGPDEAAAAVAQLATHPAFLRQHILPLLGRAQAAEAGPIIVATYGAQSAASASLQVFYWSAGAVTPIHDHSAWGVYQCVSGELLEDRYARLDDGAQPDSARLRKLWRRRWVPDDGASTVGAYTEGIHQIGNPSRRPSISIHMYGPRTSVLDGRDYDPTRDFVCDRVEDDTPASQWPALMAA